jgi:hypothetical protein
MSSRTIYLARLLGLYSIAVALSMLLHKQAMVDLVAALVGSTPLAFITGMVAVTAGLAVILGHNVWSGGALPVVVTVIGWWSLFKGLFLLFVPQATIAGLLGGGRYEQMYYVSPTVTLVLGLYLVWAGWGGGKKAGA